MGCYAVHFCGNFPQKYAYLRKKLVRGKSFPQKGGILRKKLVW